MHSQQKLGSSSIGDIAQSNAAGGALHQNVSHTGSQYVGGGAGGVGQHGQHHEGASRILSAETINERHQKKTITDLLQEIITTKSAKDTNNELSQMRFENDVVTTFFDNITKLSDNFTFSFVEELRRDVRLSLISLTYYLD